MPDEQNEPTADEDKLRQASSDEGGDEDESKLNMEDQKQDHIAGVNEPHGLAPEKH